MSEEYTYLYRGSKLLLGGEVTFIFHFSFFHFSISEKLGFLACDFGEEEVGEAGGAETEPLVRQPFLAEDFLHDGVIDEGIVNGVQTAGWFEADLDARLVVVLLDGLTHHISCLGCGGRLLLAG